MGERKERKELNERILCDWDRIKRGRIVLQGSQNKSNSSLEKLLHYKISVLHFKRNFGCFFAEFIHSYIWSLLNPKNEAPHDKRLRRKDVYSYILWIKSCFILTILYLKAFISAPCSCHFRAYKNSNWMSPKEGGIDPNPAEGRKRQVRKTSSKDVLTLSLWSKSRRPRRQTKRLQSPLLCSLPSLTLSSVGHQRNLRWILFTSRCTVSTTSHIHITHSCTMLTRLALSYDRYWKLQGPCCLM